MNKILTGVVKSFEALSLASIVKDRGKVLHIASSDRDADNLKQALAFFAPDVQVLSFPAWDTLPYDRSSPNINIIAERINTLSHLYNLSSHNVIGSISPTSKLIVITTINGSMGKVVPKDFFAGSSLSIKEGETLDEEAFKKYLSLFGYQRTEQVLQEGEYAIRGGIIDVFPTASDSPLRLDMFGDTIERIRTFSPITQISSGSIKGYTFLPASEIILNPETIASFRSKYREQFGSMVSGDELYEAVSTGQRFTGLEQWLSLFYPSLASIFNYVEGFTITRSLKYSAGVAAREEQIADFFSARQDALEIAGNSKVQANYQGFTYRPAPIKDMFLIGDELEETLSRFEVIDFTPFSDGKHIDMGSRPALDFAPIRQNPELNLIAEARDTLAEYVSGGRKVIVSAYSLGSLESLARVFRENGAFYKSAASFAEALKLAEETKKPMLAVLPLESGFISPELVLVTKDDILGESLSSPALRKKQAKKDLIGDISTLGIGDLLVHLDHGIGRYAGLHNIMAGGASHDCLLLEYADGDKLYVPVENIDVISRFGSEEAGIRLDTLGSAAWQAKKARLKKRILEMADKLMKIAAKRYLKHTPELSPPSGAFAEFISRFPYNETEDQLSAIDEVLEDLAAGRPMDRLICGDVGFGKTEVAIRAAFVVAMAGYQVAVLAPTTLLARQHFEVFSARFKGTPLRIGQLSRIVKPKEATLVKKELEAGTLDIVIGTHTLLQKTLSFKRLGLMIVDEEQHFGVMHKERIKEMAENLHILTLTATPIPRTLQLALSGVRQMSIIATPPIDRLAVRSFVTPYDPLIIKEAILREHFRGGQVFYVCPKVSDIEGVVASLSELLPDIRVVSAHGQLSVSELEKRISDFTAFKYDVLVATSIIESGIDMPSVNTLIVHRSDMFGLAQLYQLRGRVGRSKTRAYAYFTTERAISKLTETATKRLMVMQSLDSLGEGFNLASYDLDIRGAGNLLGEEQSGHIKEVGVELYQKMLEDAVAALRNGTDLSELEVNSQEAFSPLITTGVPVLIPEKYVSDLSLRLSLYRKLADIKDIAEIDSVTSEIIDRFGKLPSEVENLITTITIKLLAYKANVERIDAGEKGASVYFHKGEFPNPAGLAAFITSECGTVKIKDGNRLVCLRNWSKPAERLKGVKRLVERLANIASNTER